MSEPELLNYINQTRVQGFSDEQIRTALIEAGWGVEEIEAGLGSPDQAGEALEDSPRASQSFFSKYKKLLLISALIIIVLPALAYAGIFSFQKLNDAKEAREAEKQAQIEEQTRLAEEKEQQAAEREKEAARLRDEQRINDISSIQTALAAYFETVAAYPANLSLLVEAGQLAATPFDPDPNKEYLYTTLGEPPAYYTIAVILETEIGSLDSGLHVFSSEKLLNKEDILAQDQTIRGALTASVPGGLIVTELSGTAFKKGEEVGLEINRADGGELSYVVLTMEKLKLIDRLAPFSFSFTSPRAAGSYAVQLFGFDTAGTSYSGSTKLTVK